ncbi:hypothetical protein NE865_01721 [Phthorimaea operculella]|nr:hypothetical protein NE865_01721 [Phthorimaea operculella]
MSVCPTCTEEVKDEILCSGCSQMYHFICCQTTKTKYSNLAESTRKRWKCTTCKPAKQTSETSSSDAANISEILNIVKQTQSDFAAFKRDMKVIKDEVLALTTSINSAHESISDNTQKINILETKMSKVNELGNEVDVLKNELTVLKANLDDQNQRARLCNVEIRGIPQSGTENLLSIMEKISSTIGFDWNRDDIEFVSRIAQKDQKEKAKIKPIVLKFYKKIRKDAFLSLMKKFKGLTTQQVGLPGEAHQIFASDHLTYENKQLRRKAKMIVGEEGFVWSKDCKLLARKNSNTPIVRIQCEKDLSKLGQHAHVGG